LTERRRSAGVNPGTADAHVRDLVYERTDRSEITP
jgi:hypothetical protein